MKEIKYSDIPFEDLLSFYTVKEIKNLAAQIMLKVPSGLRKNDLVKFITTAILINPDLLLHSLFVYELKIYKDIIENPDNYPLLPENLEKFPITIIQTERKAGEEYHHTIFPGDLAEVIYSKIEKEIVRREKTGQAELENLVVGSCNLQSCIPNEKVLEWVDRRYPDKNSLERHQFIESYENVFYRFYTYKFDVFMSPYLSISDNKITTPDFIPGFDEPKEFSREEIEAASQMPYPVIGVKYRQRIINYLETKGFNELEIKGVLFEIWKNKQEDTISLPNVMHIIDFHSLEEIREWTELVSDYSNHLPFWKFYGYSSAEATEYKSKEGNQGPIHLSFGPGIRKRMMEDPYFNPDEIVRRLNEEVDREIINSGFHDESIFKKVGRNEPCPCGSGKKFKHCHGK